MELCYDEDITENVFYGALQKNHMDLLRKIIDSEWLLCVPRKGIFLEENSISRKDVEGHVLITDGTDVWTYNGEKVTCTERSVCVENGKETEVLFEETIYLTGATGRRYKLKVRCLSEALTGVDSGECGFVFKSVVDSFESCLKVLRESQVDFGELDRLIVRWCEENRKVHFVELEDLKTAVNGLYGRCLQRQNGTDLITKFCVATYVQNGIFNIIFPVICAMTCESDSLVNSRMETLTAGVRLNISEDWMETVVGKCVKEIANVADFKTVLEKLQCLKRVFKLIPASASTDSILSLLVYILITCDLCNWVATLTFVRDFYYPVSIDESGDEWSYYVTNLAAAIKYIESGSVHDPELQNAIKEGDLEGVRSLLMSRANFRQLCHPLCACNRCDFLVKETQRDIGGLTALHLAAIYGQTAIVELVITSGSDVNVRDGNRLTALHYAASRGHQQTLFYLINCGADVNMRNSDNETPLYLSTKYGHENCVKALLFAASDLHVNCITNSGDTPLKCATARGYFGIVKLLVEHGAYKHSKRKVCVLLHAVANNDLPLSRFYLDSAELAVNASNAEGVTALHVAAKHGHLHIAKMLLDRGCSPNIQGGAKCWTALHEAVENGHKSVVYELVRRPDILLDVCDDCGNSPLHIACIRRRTQIAIVLLSNGANFRLRNGEKRSPLDLATSLGLHRIVWWIDAT